jgi:hypothetical protein
MIEVSHCFTQSSPRLSPGIKRRSLLPTLVQVTAILRLVRSDAETKAQGRAIPVPSYSISRPLRLTR